MKSDVYSGLYVNKIEGLRGNLYRYKFLQPSGGSYFLRCLALSHMEIYRVKSIAEVDSSMPFMFMDLCSLFVD